jgi:integrase
MKTTGVSNISINTYICAMRAYFKWAEPERPRIAHLKEEQKLLQVFTPADITNIIRFKARNQTMKRIQALALLLADTGLRISEAPFPY